MKPDLSPHVFKFRVMRGEEIVGQFSNLELAVASARDRRNIPVVLDVSVNPPRIVFKNGMRVDQE
jgi:hypothetical protein